MLQRYKEKSKQPIKATSILLNKSRDEKKKVKLLFIHDRFQQYEKIKKMNTKVKITL